MAICSNAHFDAATALYINDVIDESEFAHFNDCTSKKSPFLSTGSMKTLRRTCSICQIMSADEILECIRKIYLFWQTL